MSLLDIQDLHVAYGPVRALRGTSLHIDETETVAVLGSNGAGKSSLLRAISGVVKPSAGTINWADEPIQGRSAYDIASRRLAHVPEGRNVFPEMTVDENLTVGGYRLRHDRKRIKLLRDQVFTLFPRLFERRGQLAASLSGGEQQMLALGRAVMSDPKLLMLDEPSLGLAPIIVARVFESVQQMRQQGLTILLVEQNATLALRHCDRAYVLSLGEIVASGTGAELQDDPAVQSAYLGSTSLAAGSGEAVAPVTRIRTRRFRGTNLPD